MVSQQLSSQIFAKKLSVNIYVDGVLNFMLLLNEYSKTFSGLKCHKDADVLVNSEPCQYKVTTNQIKLIIEKALILLIAIWGVLPGVDTVNEPNIEQKIN